MASPMHQNSAESRSGDAMSIFAQSIDVRRRPGRSRRRATMKSLSPEIEEQAKPSTERRHQRRAAVERERARAELELSRATTMAKELERQIEQANTKASSHRSGLQGTRASGNGFSRRKKGLVDVEAPGGDQALQSDTLYVEVMQELDRVKRELRKLQRAVRSAREDMAKDERDAATPTPRVMSSDSRVPDSVEGEANEERVVAELADAGEAKDKRVIAEPAEAAGLGKGIQVQATRTRAKGIIRSDKSRSSDTESFATASSSDVEDESGLTIKQHEEHDDASLHAAEAELNSARIELASIKGEGLRFVNSIERTRKETTRVTEEISRLKEQEEKASTQVQQLNAKLLRARSRLEAVTAADESAEAMLTELTSALRQLDEETEAAEKGKSLTELETQCVKEDFENVNAEIAAAEQRVRQSVRELEAVRESEAAATSKLKAAVDSEMLARVAVMSQRAGDVTIDRIEYEYLTGRAEVVRAAAEKKVAAAEAWAEALRAGEKEVAMRAEAVEKEIGKATAGEAEAADCRRADGMEPRDDGSQQRAQRRRASPGDREAPALSGRTRTPSSSVIRKPTPPSFDKRKAWGLLSCLMVIAGKCNGHS